MNAAEIVSILSVLDTREYEEVGDRWRPIQGSGSSRECDRCGREHEVHVLVALSDGGTATVGTGCMDSPTLAKAARTAAAGASRSRRVAAEVKAGTSLLERYKASLALERVVPEVVVEPAAASYAADRVRYTCGDANIWRFGPDPRGVEDVRKEWISRRVHEETGLTSSGAYSLALRLEDLDPK